MDRVPLQEIPRYYSVNKPSSNPYNYNNYPLNHPSAYKINREIYNGQENYPYAHLPYTSSNIQPASDHFSGTYSISKRENEVHPKTGRWAPEEDQNLKRIVEELGNTNDWSVIGRIMKTRTAKQCRERWCNYLDPDINQSEFTEEEDIIILNGVKKHGKCWGKIAAELKGRPNNAVKNRFNTVIIKKYKYKDENSQDDADLVTNEYKEKKPLRSILPRKEIIVPAPPIENIYFPPPAMEQYKLTPPRHSHISKKRDLPDEYHADLNYEYYEEYDSMNQARKSFVPTYSEIDANSLFCEEADIPEQIETNEEYNRMNSYEEPTPSLEIHLHQDHVDYGTETDTGFNFFTNDDYYSIAEIFQ